MKSLISAIGILILITAFVIFSSIFISNFCDGLLEYAKALPSADESGNIPKNISDYSEFETLYSKIHEDWLKRRAYIRCTIGHYETEQIEDALSEVSVRFISKDGAGYMYARRRLISLIEELKLAEMPTIYAFG